MKRLALSLAGLVLCGVPALAADLDGPPVYREKRVYIERPDPPVVVERRIIEHHYYYHEPEVAYVRPRFYAPYGWSDAWYEGAYGYRRAGYYARAPYSRHRYRHRRW
jgi:hypothetical protein